MAEQDPKLYTMEDIARAAQEAMEDDEVQGFAADPMQQYGRMGMKFLNNLASISGGTLTPGCCTQGCCGDVGGFRV